MQSVLEAQPLGYGRGIFSLKNARWDGRPFSGFLRGRAERQHFSRERERRVLVVYVFRWGRVVLPGGGAVAVRPRIRRIENLSFLKENRCFWCWNALSPGP